MIPKVLVGVVTYNGKDYCKEEFEARLNNLSYESYQFVIVDTTEFKGNSRHKITKGYNTILKMFKESKQFDYLLTLEADVIPPKYIIEALMAHNLDIVGAMYAVGPTKNRFPCAFTGKAFKIKNYLGQEHGSGIQSFEWSDLDGTVKEAPGGCGLGCVLIKRDVLNKLEEFRYGEAHCDMYFHEDCYKNGFKTYVDTSIICKHYGTWEEWNTIIGQGRF